MIRVSVIGGSGYVGGEVLRLLLGHPLVEVGQVTSERRAGQFVHSVHPNLRSRTGQPPLKFSAVSQLDHCDLLYLCLPHGEAMERMADFGQVAPKIIDMSADFRLRSGEDYLHWYGREHTAPAWLERFVYGLPEVYRGQIVGADDVSGVGCNATVTILALWPLFRADLVDRERGVVVEVKVGSSEGGNRAGDASHHPERSGAVRSFAPVGHRHTAEVIQVLAQTGSPAMVHFSVTSIEMVRGAVATAHLFLKEPLKEKDLWRAYRAAYRDEPFVRIVKERSGIYRYPEPKILTGSNFCDVGFALDEDTGRVVTIAAIDNLMKGAAGSAVQCMNLMHGWPETTGLDFTGLHPI